MSGDAEAWLSKVRLCISETVAMRHPHPMEHIARMLVDPSFQESLGLPTAEYVRRHDLEQRFTNALGMAGFEVGQAVPADMSSRLSAQLLADAKPQSDVGAPARDSVPMHESKYAGGEWTVEGFVASLPVPSAVADALRHKSSVPAGCEFEFVRSFTSEAAIVERLREGQLVESVAKEVWAGTQKLQGAQAASGAELNAKFAADGDAFKGEMGFGGTDEFYAGAASCAATLNPPPHDATFARHAPGAGAASALQPSPRDATFARPFAWRQA
jgi:hypothetical protein